MTFILDKEPKIETKQENEITLSVMSVHIVIDRGVYFLKITDQLNTTLLGAIQWCDRELAS